MNDREEWLNKIKDARLREWLARAENGDVLEWLRELKTDNTIRVWSWVTQRFFEWYAVNHEGQTAQDFAKVDPKAMAHELLFYQSHLQQHGTSANTIRIAVTAIRSYCEYLDKPLRLKNKIVKSEIDTSSHVFENGDLTAMFNVGDTKEKAILATMASLGWECEGVLELKREFIEQQLAIATSAGAKFVFFNAQRGKTHALRYGILNPLAIEWIQKWLAGHASTAHEPLFNLTRSGLNKLLRRLATEAKIKTSGRVHSHLIRGWTMSQLSDAGFNEWEVKFAVGKAIPASDATYLRRLKNAIEDKYPKVYDQYLNINPPIIKETVKPEQVKSLEEQVKALTELVAEQKKEYEAQREEFRRSKGQIIEAAERLKSA